MKKLLIVLLAFALVAGLFTVAAAEDKLSLSGTMRVRAWDVENYADFDDNNKSDEASNWDQRFRLAATIKANDAVSGHLRFDFAEDTWGSDNWSAPGSWGGSRYDADSELQVDRAYLQAHIADWATVKAGQLYFATGDRYIVYDNNCTGVVWQLKFNPITVDLHYSKLNENGSNNDDDLFDDTDAYVAQVKFKAENFSMGAFYAAIEDSRPSSVENSASAFGVFGKFALGPVNFLAEADFFDGDASPTVEYMGTQLFLNAEWKMDALLLGADIYYAEAADSDGSEIQLEGLTDFGDFLPHTYGAFVEDYQPTPGKVHDFTNDDAGVTGGAIYAKYIWDKLTLWGQIAYLEPEDDKMTRYDDMTVLNASASYEVVQNFTLSALYSTTFVSVDDNSPDDDASTIAARLQIKF